MRPGDKHDPPAGRTSIRLFIHHHVSSLDSTITICISLTSHHHSLLTVKTFVYLYLPKVAQ